jgi:hypothetical protein
MCYFIVLRDVVNLVIPHYVQQLWKKNAYGVFVCFLKEFAFAVGRSGASCEA